MMKSASRQSFLFLAVSALLFFLPSCLSGQDVKDLFNMGKEFIKQAKYWDALPRLEEYIAERPDDVVARRMLALAQSHTNNYSGAAANYKKVIESSRKADPELIFALAEAQHQSEDFKEAIQQYKKYISLEDDRDLPQRLLAIANIKRCAIGLSSYDMELDAVVENMGVAVNTKQDEIIPVESPNVDNRVYFSSLRNTRFVDEFDDRGKLVSIKMYRDFDMYSTQIENGAWSRAAPLNTALNTQGDEILQDFSSDGRVAIFTRNSDAETSTVFVDTFDAEAAPNPGEIWQHSPNFKDAKLEGLHFFSDSVAVFSSNTHGGFGGYDLFVAFQDDAGWQVANLGEPINTMYDEISPFLAYDGRTVFYSSNGLQSMGGFDIFRATFDDQKQDWSDAVNLGRPINSSVNDVFYRFTRDGGTAYLSSDRSGTEGGLDLYSIYYRTPSMVQAARSIPMLFTQVRDFQLFSETLVDNSQPNVPDDVVAAEQEFHIPSLYFRAENQMLSPQNVPKLETIARLAKTYPHAILEIASHSDENPTTNFDLYFCIRRAEEVASFLIENGVSPSSLLLRGYGGSYPLVRTQIGDKLNETGKWFNRRIDVLVQNQAQLPIEVISDLPEVSAALQDETYPRFRARTKALHYRIHFATLDQMYKGDITTSFSDAMIQKNIDGQYIYSVGLHSSFADALAMLSEVKETGIYDAEIVPYEAGRQLGIGEIDAEKLAEHPDLKEYILFLN